MAAGRAAKMGKDRKARADSRTRGLATLRLDRQRCARHLVKGKQQPGLVGRVDLGVPHLLDRHVALPLVWRTNGPNMAAPVVTSDQTVLTLQVQRADVA